MRIILLATALALSPVACGDGAEGGATTSTTTGETSTTGGTNDQVPETVTGAIVADAAERTGVPAADVEVVSVQAETFSDASLGCPQPGRMYAQVVTPGHRVIVDAGSSELDYRTAEGSDSFVLCE